MFWLYFCHLLILVQHNGDVSPQNANSNLLWNTATQITCYPNLHHITFIHHCEKLKQTTQWIVHAGKTELQIHIMFWTNTTRCNVAALCNPSELWFLLPVKWNNKVKGYNKTKSCNPFWNAKCYEFYIYRWIYRQHNYPRYTQLPKQKWKYMTTTFKTEKDKF